MTVASKTFPISFTSAYQVIGSIADSTYLNAFAPVYISVNSITNTGFQNPDTDGYIGGKRTWVAFGIQQWGYAVEGTTKVSFPIVFNALFVVSNSQKYNAQSDDVDNILTTNNTYFTKSNLSNAFAWWWLAIGKQQWGVRDSATAGTLYFPILFTNTPTFLRCNQSVVNSSLMASGGGYSQLTTKSVYLLADGGIPVQPWIATGLQQWGYQNLGNSTSYNMTVTFPVAYQSNVFSILGYHQQNSGSAFASGWLYVENISLSSFRMKWRNNMFWAVIGVQQWGNITTAVNDGTVTFPIAYVTSTYFATADPMSDGSFHTNNVAIYNRTNKSFDFDFYQGHIIRAWFAIGY